jgi:hypothetical protein
MASTAGPLERTLIYPFPDPDVSKISSIDSGELVPIPTCPVFLIVSLGVLVTAKSLVPNKELENCQSPVVLSNPS